ncbi:MAG TPA: hypothetical protein VIQ99_09305 [Gammaproteobacteria bacterium]
MHAFEFALALIALVFLFKLLNTMMLRKGAMRRRDEQADAELLERLNQVEERVRVLERIVTDDRFDLKQQFRDLGS